MNEYSPFDKEIHQIEVSDLAVLKNVVEGWYVEYKQAIPNTASIAKSISAFSNTYGGWLFYGIAELSKGVSVAGTFMGIADISVDAALQTIRNAVSEHLNPSAHFETKVLFGPCESIGLSAGTAIICIWIPSSTTAPHVHKDGRIYQRVADSSDPTLTNDRFVLDQMWKRAQGVDEAFLNWYKNDFELSEGEENPYIRVMIAPSIFHNRMPAANLELHQVREILAMETGAACAVPFDTVFTTAPGFIARQNANNNPQDLGLTWRLRGNLSGDVLIPLKFIVCDVSEVSHRLYGYSYAERFKSILIKRGFKSTRIVDLNYLFNILCGIVQSQNRLHDAVGWSRNFHTKVKLLNVWRTCPFIDVPSILNNFEVHGIPMSLSRNMTSPSGMTADSFLTIDAHEEIEDEFARIIVQATMVFWPIATAFGVQMQLDGGDPEEPPYYQELQEAGQRAIAIQKRISTTN